MRWDRLGPLFAGIVVVLVVVILAANAVGSMLAGTFPPDGTR